MDKLKIAQFAYMLVVVLLNLISAGFYLLHPIRHSPYQKTSLNYFLAFFLLFAFGFVIYSLSLSYSSKLIVPLTCFCFIAAFYCLKYGFIWRLHHYAQPVYKVPTFYFHLLLVIGVNGYIFQYIYDSNLIRIAFLLSNCCLIAVFSIKHVAANPPEHSFGEKVAVTGLMLSICAALALLLLLKVTNDPFVYVSALMVTQSLVVLVILGSTLTMALSDISKLYYEDSITDVLTGLYNRRFFLSQASLAVKTASRHDFPISIIICDIDNFKLINDTFGHDIGDKAIIEFSQAIKTAARETDIIARLGGDEFIILLSKSDAKGAFGLADRMRELTAAIHLESDKGEVKFTASFGVSSFESTIDIESNIKEADLALYVAKRVGRNNVQSYDPSMTMS